MNLRLSFLLLLLLAAPATAEVKILLPLGRTAYQTNERIDLAIVRSGKLPLPAGPLQLDLKGADGSKLDFAFPLKAVEDRGGTSRAVEHLHVQGWALRPGKYTVEVGYAGEKASTEIEVYSHLRRSSFKLINWGRAKSAEQQLVQGENSLGYNLFYGHYGQDEEGNFIRAGVDFMANCVMSGGHQMDLRLECDWSDPLVIRGGTRRVVKRAFIDRARGNVPGVHFYDEPGLTWGKHPVTGEFGPHDIPAQVRSYQAAYGKSPPPYHQMDGKNPQMVEAWKHWARWKLGFMDAAWRDAQFGVSSVRPDYLSVTQSQYGWSAFTDGYYFNVVRSLPIISGHGGYHDFGPGYFNPSLFLEFARARDFSRPNWYLPTWYSSTTSDQFRLEQNLSFQTGIQGIMSPPDLEPGTPSKNKAAAGIVETNHLFQRLGPIFTTMKPSRAPVALLYSLSQCIHTQANNTKKNYAHDTAHGRNLMFSYLALKQIQHGLTVVLDEDILDGTLQAEHRAIVLTSIDYLDPEVIAGLEKFAKNGGVVLLTGDCTVKIQGATNLGVTPSWPDAAQIEALRQEKKDKEAGALQRLRQALAGARPLGAALQKALAKAGIAPVLGCNQPGIVATSHKAGDVEYIFAVNASHDEQGDPMLGMKPVQTELAFPRERSRSLYDGVRGGWVQLEHDELRGSFAGTFDFGPGQMRVWAVTTQPIQGVKVGTPIVQRDFTLPENPLRLEISAVVLNDKGGLVSGSIPLRIRLLDPQGNARHDLYRATEQGTLRLNLPLAVNEPAGEWRVVVSELLANTTDTARITLPAISSAALAAGASRRAVHLEQDRANIFRFFRTHQQVTIVKGASPYNDDAAQRLVKVLQPWNVKATVVTAAEVNKPRSLSPEEAATFIGLDYAGKGQIKPGEQNSPALVGYVVQGPVILLGTPEDNPLIATLQKNRFLPYAAKLGEMPGPQRGYVAWQREAIGVLQESITLIAHDGEGMAEAVGTMYEMLAGMDPLTPLALPKENSIAAGEKKATPELRIAWSAVFPDRITGLASRGQSTIVLTDARTRSTYHPGTKKGSMDTFDTAQYAKALSELGTRLPATPPKELIPVLPRDRVVKYVAKDAQTWVVFWGGDVHAYNGKGELVARYAMGQDVTAVHLFGDEFRVGDADGRVTALQLP